LRVRRVRAAAHGEVDRHPPGCRVDQVPDDRAGRRVVNGAVLSIAGTDLVVRAPHGVVALCEDIGPGVVADERIPDLLDIVPDAGQRDSTHARNVERDFGRLTGDDGYGLRIGTGDEAVRRRAAEDRKSTRLNSSHQIISY